MESHRFELPGSGGETIRGEVRVPARRAAGDRAPLPVVVCVHGFKGFRRWGFWPRVAERLAEPGRAVVTFDMSHNGVGPGGLDFDRLDLFERNTWAREEEDLARVLAAVRSRSLEGTGGVDPSRVALVGHSRGGGLAVVHAADDPGVRAVVALAPIATIARFPDELVAASLDRGWLPIVNTRTGQEMRVGADALREGLARTELHDLAAHFASRLPAPLLVAHGADDTSVPQDEGRRLAAAAPGGRFLGFPGADHVLGCRHPFAGTTPDLEEFLDAADAFLEEHLER